MTENGSSLSIQDQVWNLLAGVYEPEGIEIWLTNGHVDWGGRNVAQMIADGEGARVLQKADQLATGAYA